MRHDRCATCPGDAGGKGGGVGPPKGLAQEGRSRLRFLFRPPASKIGCTGSTAGAAVSAAVPQATVQPRDAPRGRVYLGSIASVAYVGKAGGVLAEGVLLLVHSGFVGGPIPPRSVGGVCFLVQTGGGLVFAGEFFGTKWGGGVSIPPWAKIPCISCNARSCPGLGRIVWQHVETASWGICSPLRVCSPWPISLGRGWGGGGIAGLAEAGRGLDWQEEPHRSHIFSRGPGLVGLWWLWVGNGCGLGLLSNCSMYTQLGRFGAFVTTAIRLGGPGAKPRHETPSPPGGSGRGIGAPPQTVPAARTPRPVPRPCVGAGPAPALRVRALPPAPHHPPSGRWLRAFRRCSRAAPRTIG